MKSLNNNAGHELLKIYNPILSMKIYHEINIMQDTLQSILVIVLYEIDKMILLDS